VSRKAVAVCTSAVAVLLICLITGVAAGSEQVRIVVRLLGEDISSKCTAVISTEDGGIGAFFDGDENGLQGQLPPGMYSAIITQREDSDSLAAVAEFEVIAGRETVVEVEMMNLDLVGLLGALGLLVPGSPGEFGYGSGDAPGGSLWDFDEDDFGENYDEYSLYGADYDEDTSLFVIPEAQGFRIWSPGSSGSAAGKQQSVDPKQPAVDPWMADIGDRPFMGPWGPLDE
jgi:hypothetical protein